ncbi:MAG: hypothetical protein K0S51_2586 [Bacillales bacterium]|nr:hypothetical protein [Bacillales bacterium]
MKINQNLRTNIETNKQDIKQLNNTAKNFGVFIQKHTEKLHHGQLTRLISEIEQQGTRVSRSRTFKDLSRFKSLVKRFMQEAVEYGLDLNQSSGWSLEGYSRTLSTVELIDEKLIELTESVLDKHKNSIDILEKIGEIKGLLINIYT